MTDYSDMTETEYSEKIESIAETEIWEAIECGEPIGSDLFEDYLMKTTLQTANCSDITLGVENALMVLQHAESPPEEWQIYVDPEQKNNHQAVLEAMAHSCFSMDLVHAVYDKLKKLREQHKVVA